MGKKALTFLFLSLFLLAVLTACTQKIAEQKIAESGKQVNTPIDKDVKDIDAENSDLSDNDLDGLDEDLDAIDSI